MMHSKMALGRADGGADPMRAAAQAMKKAGLAATVPRMAVWRVVAGSDRPLDAMEIKRRLVDDDLDIAMSSIYLALKRLTAAELFATCTITGRAHYHLASRCFRQRIMIEGSGDEQWFADPDFGRAVEAFCGRHGFNLSDYTLSVKGRRMVSKEDDAGR